MKHRVMITICTLLGFLSFIWSDPAFAKYELKIVSLPASASPGQSLTLTIQTVPGAKCKIDVHGIPLTQLPALQPKTADTTGKASWTFTVNQNYTADKLPIILTCSTKDEKMDTKLLTAIPVIGIADNSQVKLDFQSTPTSIAPGQDVTVSVVTKPGTLCKILAQDAGMTQAFALSDKRSDKTGKVSWKFKVNNSYKADKLPIIVTGHYGKKERKILSAIPINRPM